MKVCLSWRTKRAPSCEEPKSILQWAMLHTHMYTRARAHTHTHTHALLKAPQGKVFTLQLNWHDSV